MEVNYNLSSGFAFPIFKSPTGINRGLKVSPDSRPNLIFDGNSAHSSGFWWDNGAAIYVGGIFTQSSDSIKSSAYNPGRTIIRHDSCLTTGLNLGCKQINWAWMKFTNTKVYLANRGFLHWGERSEINRLEAHDTGIGANAIGRVWMTKMLITCRTNNTQPKFVGCPEKSYYLCHNRDYNFWTGFQGFQWYDVGQSHIVTSSTFRNCNDNWPYCIKSPCTGASVFSFLTHSDQFAPEQMQATKMIRYENVNPSQIWRFTKRTNRTVSGRLQNWLDLDGSASLKKGPQLLGSTWANNWWNLGNDTCVRFSANMDMWQCPLQVLPYPKTSVASIILEVDPKQTSLIGSTICSNGDNKPCPEIGYATHLNRAGLKANGLALTDNTKITGPINFQLGNGWFVRYIAGAPKSFQVKNIQLETASTTLLLAFPYPPYTAFTIKAYAAFGCFPGLQNTNICQYSYIKVDSLKALVKRTTGEGYFYDSKTNVLYLQVVENADNSLGVGTFTRKSNGLEFVREGVSLPRAGYNYRISINSNCTTLVNSLYCALPKDLDDVRTVPLVQSVISDKTIYKFLP
jgi:hypothetical protein